MIFSTGKRRLERLLLLTTAAVAGASCDGDDDEEIGGELEARDAAGGTGATGSGGTSAAAGGGGPAETGGTGAAPAAGGTNGASEIDSGPVDPGPCGKQFERCCGISASCVSPELSCNDSACVSCAQVPSAKTGCTNVAPRGTATAILTRAPDVQAPDYSPRLAIDGNVCNVWASGDYATNPEAGLASTWWEVDLGTPLVLSAMTLWLAMTPAGPVELHLEHSTDHVVWNTLFSGPRPMSGHAPWLYDFPQPISARHFRIWFNASPSWISIRELGLFECP